MVLTDSEAKFLISAIRTVAGQNPPNPQTWTFPTMEPTPRVSGLTPKPKGDKKATEALASGP